MVEENVYRFRTTSADASFPEGSPRPISLNSQIVCLYILSIESIYIILDEEFFFVYSMQGIYLKKYTFDLNNCCK